MSPKTSLSPERRDQRAAVDEAVSRWRRRRRLDVRVLDHRIRRLDRAVRDRVRDLNRNDVVCGQRAHAVRGRHALGAFTQRIAVVRALVDDVDRLPGDEPDVEGQQRRRAGLRRVHVPDQPVRIAQPYAQISLRAPSAVANGLSFGMR